MKIRQDFVTNSSSTSFGAATVTGIATALATAIGISAAAGADEAGNLGSKEKKTEDEGPDRDFDPDRLINSEMDYGLKQEKLDREIEEYEKEWAETKDTLDEEDYEKTKSEYEEYIKYLKNKKDEAESIEYEKQIEKLTKEAEKEYKETWIEERKKDLENAREQIEFIEASNRGYGKAGYNVEEGKKQLEMYKAREKDLEKALKKEGVEHNYKAKEREDIGPSESVAELIKKVDDKYDAVLKKLSQEKIDRKKKAIIERNIEAWREESKEYMKYSNTADKYMKTAEIVQQAADIGVDALEKVTGPAGKTIKKAYVAGKALGSGAGEAYADPDNAASHMAKASIKAAGDVAKEFTENQYVKDGINIVSETSQEMVTSYQKGEDLSTGVKKGLIKAGVEIVGDRVADALPKVGRDIDFGNYTGKQIIKSVAAGNPTVKEFIKDSIKDSMKNSAVNQAKNLAKGDGAIVSDWNLYKL
ncbi:MAG: hypothetical protein JW702_01585 [Clostridiales bacterium]|nr:hypothetical protein [Clostridiales bacterium]